MIWSPSKVSGVGRRRHATHHRASRRRSAGSCPRVRRRSRCARCRRRGCAAHRCCARSNRDSSWPAVAESMPEPAAGAVARLRACLRRTIARRVPLLRRRLLGVAPAAVAVLLPAVALLPVDVAVAPGVDITAAALPGERLRQRPAVLRLTIEPPPLPSVTRVVVPVRLFVTREVVAQSSPRVTPVWPQLP